MKNLIIALSLLSSMTAFAANPGVACRASTKVAILIETQKNQVRVVHWGEIVETLAILKTDVRFLERKPAIWRTSYDLGQGYVLETMIQAESGRGTGVLKINGEKKVDYTSCYTAEDIKR